jgi:hypothetical protein
MIKRCFRAGPLARGAWKENIMNMRIGLIALPFLCLAGVASADGRESAGVTAGQTEKAAPARAQVRARMAGPRAKYLPRGDLRYCLDRKTEAAIIRCAETGRKR